MGCEGIRGRTGARAVGTSYPHIHRLVHPLPGPHPRYRRLISTRRGGLTTNGIHATLPASLSNGSGPPQSTEKRVTILRCSVDGQSIRGTARIAGVAVNSVVKLLLEAGKIAGQDQDERLRDLPCTRLAVRALDYCGARATLTDWAMRPRTLCVPTIHTPLGTGGPGGAESPGFRGETQDLTLTFRRSS